jgi:hypothetical protein
MYASKSVTGNAAAQGEIEITDAALDAYSRLVRAVAGRVTTHGASDGGLICEYRTLSGRPTILRVSPDGALLPDSPYNFVLGAFIPAGLPRGVS